MPRLLCFLKRHPCEKLNQSSKNDCFLAQENSNFVQTLPHFEFKDSENFEEKNKNLKYLNGIFEEA